MKKGLTELVYILDKSGSMHGLEKDTIGGFNSMIAQQREQEGQVNVTTVLFDDEYKLLHDRFPISVIRPMTSKDYFVGGCTALLDAMGKTIDKIRYVQDYLPEEEKAEKVIVVITTDGYENASKEYTYEKIKQLVERQRKEFGWEFLFLGANMDAVKEAGKFGIKKDRSVTYLNDSEGVARNFSSVSGAISQMRRAASMDSVGAEWKEEIEEDYRSRSGNPGTGRKTD